MSEADTTSAYTQVQAALAEARKQAEQAAAAYGDQGKLLKESGRDCRCAALYVGGYSSVRTGMRVAAAWLLEVD